MFLFPAFCFLLQQAFSVSAAPLSEPDYSGSLMLTEPSANSIRFNSTRPEPITRLTKEVLFPIEGTTLSLSMFVDRAASIDKTALRNAIYNAWTTVSNIIDISGDGDLPASSNPYEVVTDGAYIGLDESVKAHRKLKWSDVKEILWGLRTFMVVQGNSFRMAFLIVEEGQADVLGSGRVLEGDPIYTPLRRTFNPSGVLKFPS
ncbi:hypothetical protein BDR22DRAFT_891572 [Usnea florida]